LLRTRTEGILTVNAVLQPEIDSELERTLWRIYRDFFDTAEKKRRWRIREDIPWNDCNPNLDPAIADVVETFCCVELYLPDYISKILPLVRASKGRAWFYANWGYEESKHSLVLGDWLLRSKHRTEEYMADLEKKVFAREWNLPHDCALGMLAYAMVQEHATFINYRNLKVRVAELGGDPALETILNYVSIDEAAHFGLFRQFYELFLKFDREPALVALRPVLNQFQMPAIHDLLDENKRRIAEVRDLGIFNEEIFFRDIYGYFLNFLGISRSEMRGPRIKKSLAT
jgi:acyl-[acyl-carrier-protein] desaturase